MRVRYRRFKLVVKGNMSAEPVALKKSDIFVEKARLHQPPLDEIVKCLNLKLKNNFKQVQVEIVDCPNLTEKPFTLACAGLGGSPTIIELGGVPYLLPTPKREKLYDLKDIGDILNMNPTYLTGAGAGPWPYAKANCEMIVNMEINNGKPKNHTRICKVDVNNGECVQEVLPDSETRSALLANLFASQGQSGKVLRVFCKTRTGSLDFIASIRKSLEEEYGSLAVGLGGVFVVSQGKVKQHVMPDFSAKPLNSEDDLNNWLKFYNMSTPLIAVGTLVSTDPGLDLRLQHFHSFSHHGEGGHYHNDTTPETIEYLGYFALGEQLCRLDRPKETHLIGRD